MADARSLQRGDQVPHMEVRTLGGGVFSYTTTWQRKNFVLVAIPEAAAPSSYISELSARAQDFADLEGVFVVTHDDVHGLPAPGVLVADRWGEIAHVAIVPLVSDLPTASELLGWLDYVQRRCPECEGEAK